MGSPAVKARAGKSSAIAKATADESWGFEHPESYQQPMLIESAPREVLAFGPRAEAGYENMMQPVETEDLEALESAAQLTAENEAANAWRKLVAESWAELREIEKGGGKKDNVDREEEQRKEVMQQQEQASQKQKYRFWGKQDKSSEQKEGKEDQQAKQNNGNQYVIPQTFEEMTILNATMIGANLTYIKIVQQCMDRLVSATAKGEQSRLELEVNVVALRMHKDVEGDMRIGDFKLCMLASLRSLLPKSWSIAHEQAWIAMMDGVEQILHANRALPGKYEKAVERFVSSLPDEEKRQYGLNAFNRFFDKVPKAENHFNTSNARLSFLAAKGLDMAMDMYKTPTRAVNDTTTLGLRHIMYNIETSYFEPFVQALVEELKNITTDELVIEGIEWSLMQIACIMVFTIDEGSNPLLMAVIANSPKMVKAALAGVARKDRAEYCL